MPQRRRNNLTRAFTLLEAMMAVTILLVAVIAVTGAVTAGQQHALEARQRIAGAMAAEDLLGRLSTLQYSDLLAWNGFVESVGNLSDMSGQPMPEMYNMIGRTVSVTTSLENLPGLDVRVRGRRVRVQAFNSENRILADLSLFVPEPQS